MSPLVTKARSAKNISGANSKKPKKSDRKLRARTRESSMPIYAPCATLKSPRGIQFSGRFLSSFHYNPIIARCVSFSSRCVAYRSRYRWRGILSHNDGQWPVGYVVVNALIDGIDL